MTQSFLPCCLPALAASIAMCAHIVGAQAPAPTELTPDVATPIDEAPQDISPLLVPIVRGKATPGMVACVIRGEAIVMIGAAGVRRAGEDRPVTIHDMFHLGSCTKAMTATLCAMLVEDGRLDRTTTLAQAFPAHFTNDAHKPWREVTLAHLLTNRGGVPGTLDAGGLWGRLGRHKGTPVEARALLLKGVLERDPAHAPGHYEYSNAGFAIAGHMAETRMGTPFETLMQERLFAPLGITSAGFGAPGVAGANDQPRGHAGTKPIEPGPNADNPPAITPAGRVHMPMADWAKFVSLHLRGHAQNPARECRLLTPESFDWLHAPGEGPGTPYAAGWIVAERPWADGVVLTHSGSNTMWFCVAWLAPRKNLGVLVACNAGGPEAQKACDIAASMLIREALSKPKAP